MLEIEFLETEAANMFLRIIIFATLIVSTGITNLPAQLNFDRGKVFDEVSTNVSKHFYNKKFDQKAWDQTVRKYRKLALAAKTHDGFAKQVNALLATLSASHTYYYSVNNPKRYQLLGVFHPLFDQGRTDLFVYDGIGVDTRTIEGKVRVVSVYDGHPAAKAGLQFGDQIVSVDSKPFHPIKSFVGRADTTVNLEIIRGRDRKNLKVKVEKLDGRKMFEKALDASARVIESKGKQIGYIHAWSYAGWKYHNKIRSELLWGKLSKCDSLILDLRDGWGGADLSYLNLFREPIASMRAETRSGDVRSFSGVWGKPVVLLTNERSTSGKEAFTYGFKKLKLGKVVGETTAGAVLGGRIFLLSNGDVLYLAVLSMKIDGQRLEGTGVAPDFKVKRDIKKGGADHQLNRALEILDG